MSALKPLLKEQAITAFNANYIKSLLFSSGEAGVLYVPVPQFDGQTLLYQDAAGTTPVTADGDPVGLGLEWSKGLELGPELLTNGAFDTDADWDLGTGWTISGGVATSSGTNLSVISQPAEILAGSTYEITYTVTNYESGSFRAEFQGGGVDEGVTRSANGTYTELLTAGIGRDNFRVISFGGGFVGSVDNISVKELPGNHATQSTSADRPTYNTDGTLHWLAHDGAGDNLKSTYASPVAQPCTLSVAIDKQDAGADKVIATGLSSTDRHQISINASGNLVAIAGSTTLDSGQALANGKHIVTVVLDGANSSIRVDGASIATGDLGADSSGGLTLSSLWDGTLSIAQDVYGAIHAEGVDDVGRVESYLNDRIGGGVL